MCFQGAPCLAVSVCSTRDSPGHKHQSDAIQKFHYECDFLVMITHVLANDGINQGMSKGNNLWIADTVIFFEGTWDVGMGCSFQGREGRQAKP